MSHHPFTITKRLSHLLWLCLDGLAQHDHYRLSRFTAHSTCPLPPGLRLSSLVTCFSSAGAPALLLYVELGAHVCFLLSNERPIILHRPIDACTTGQLGLKHA
ncbi:unnamed protein product [Orchesella dallaii]|uniref:Secreted protein n=1 Tax=Orchesella dallaii TaxID=48710 RepID=A0ABP1SAB2_9HEXA